MKQPFMIICLLAFVVGANGFSPSTPAPRKAFDKQRSNKQATSASTNGGEVSTWYPDSPPKGNQAAKLAAFAAAIAPLAANAQEIDQGDGKNAIFSCGPFIG